MDNEKLKRKKRWRKPRSRKEIIKMNRFLSDWEIDFILSVIESTWEHDKCPENEKK